MPKKALLVIDMLKDFVEKNGALYCGEASYAIIPFVTEKIEEFRAAGDPVIFIMDAHAKDDPQFKLFGRHCVAGSEGAELGGGLEIRGSDYVVKKASYDGYYNTTLQRILEENKIDEIFITGVCTSICVMETAGSLARRNYKVSIYRDGVADFDQGAHEFALERMKKIYGARVV